MTSTLLVLLLLSLAEGPDNPPDGEMEPPLSASSAGRWGQLVRGLKLGSDNASAAIPTGATRWRFLGGACSRWARGGTLLFPEGDGALRPGAFASVGLGVDNAR